MQKEIHTILTPKSNNLSKQKFYGYLFSKISSNMAKCQRESKDED